MATSMSNSSFDDLEIVIRRLRKKLRQIEILDRLNRPLVEEEIVKVNSKASLRKKLQAALAELAALPPTQGERVDAVTEKQQHQEPKVINEVQTLGTKNVHEQFEINPNQSELQPSQKETQKEKELLPSLNSDVIYETVISQIKDETPFARDKEAVKGGGDLEKKSRKKKKRGSNQPGLSGHSCTVRWLEAHNDVITDLSLFDDLLVTASRDTTLRCWDVTTGRELRILGSHTETVTCLCPLNSQLSHMIKPSLSQEDSVIVSGSFDCYLKMWSLRTGQLLESIYTYNPVTALDCLTDHNLLASGSDGGKLEIWDPTSKQNYWSSIVHSETVTGIKVDKTTVYSSCADGVLKVHYFIPESQQLSCQFVSERLVTADLRQPVQQRHVRSLTLTPSGQVVYGDDSRNLKILDWKTGTVKKISNHHHAYSSADALNCQKDFLFAASYDLDQGLGYINVFTADSLQYLATVNDKDTDRIMCVDARELPSKCLRIVTGGVDLKVWDIDLSDDESRSGGDIHTEYHSILSRPARDSQSETEDENCSSEEDREGDDNEDTDPNEETEDSTAGWMSWCSVI